MSEKTGIQEAFRRFEERVNFLEGIVKQIASKDYLQWSDVKLHSNPVKYTCGHSGAEFISKNPQTDQCEHYWRNIETQLPKGGQKVLCRTSDKSSVYESIFYGDFGFKSKSLLDLIDINEWMPFTDTKER
jgi:hypothetical protein